MKKISLIIITILLISLTNCQKQKTFETNINNYQTFVDEYYQFQIGEKEEYVAIDLRSLDDYAKGHFKGFISFHYDETKKESLITMLTGMYNKNHTIFLIDYNGEVVTEVATLIKDAGYKTIYIYTSGYESLVPLTTNDLFVVTGTDDCGC